MHKNSLAILVLCAAAFFFIVGPVCFETASAASKKSCIKNDCAKPKKSYLRTLAEHFKKDRATC